MFRKCGNVHGSNVGNPSLWIIVIRSKQSALSSSCAVSHLPILAMQPATLHHLLYVYPICMCDLYVCNIYMYDLYLYSSDQLYNRVAASEKNPLTDMQTCVGR